MQQDNEDNQNSSDKSASDENSSDGSVNESKEVQNPNPGLVPPPGGLPFPGPRGMMPGRSGFMMPPGATRIGLPPNFQGGNGMNQGIPNQGMPNQGMPNQGMPNQGMPNQGMSNQGMPNQGMSNQGMPNQGMPNQGMPNQGMPNQGMPNQGMPNQGMPNQGMPNPNQGMPNQGVPNQGMSNQGVPNQGGNNPPQGVNQQGGNGQQGGIPPNMQMQGMSLPPGVMPPNMQMQGMPLPPGGMNFFRSGMMPPGMRGIPMNMPQGVPEGIKMEVKREEGVRENNKSKDNDESGDNSDSNTDDNSKKSGSGDYGQNNQPQQNNPPPQNFIPNQQQMQGNPNLMPGMQNMNMVMNPQGGMSQGGMPQGMPNFPGGFPPGFHPMMMQNGMMFMNRMPMPGGMPPGMGFPPKPFGAPPPDQMQHFQSFTGKDQTFTDIEPMFQSLITRNPPPDCLIDKLPSSKTPVIDAFIYCSICNWGVSITPPPGDRVPSVFTINDFTRYWDFSQKICSKPSPTETPVARLKALRRWFADFPGIKKIKAVKEGKESIAVRVKPERINDVITILKKYSQIINSRCKGISQGGGSQNFSGEQYN